MANQFIYTPTSLSDEGPKPPRRCKNCAFIDMFITGREAKRYIEGGARYAFKNEHGEIIGYPADALKTFCTKTCSSVSPHHGVCRDHRWSDEIWAGPTNELTIC